MGADFSALNDQVTRIEEVVPAIVAALNGIADQIDAAVEADNLEDNTQTALLSDKVRTQADALAGAIVTGTPAAKK